MPEGPLNPLDGRRRRRVAGDDRVRGARVRERKKESSAVHLLMASNGTPINDGGSPSGGASLAGYRVGSIGAVCGGEREKKVRVERE